MSKKYSDYEEWAEEEEEGEEENEEAAADDDLDEFEGDDDGNAIGEDNSEDGEPDPVEEDGDDEPDGEDEEPDEDNEIIVTIGDEEPEGEPEAHEKAPKWVRSLRRSNRDITKENRELKAQLAAAQHVEVEPTVVGEKPKLLDFDYDEEAFGEALEKWVDDKAVVDSQAATQQAAVKKREAEWNERLGTYNEAKTKIPVRDFDDAEGNVLESLDVTQQSIIISGADDAAKVIYALGRNDVHLKRMAGIKDPVKFAVAVGKLEKDLRVKPRTAKTKPEARIAGKGKTTTETGKLARLREKAAETGNFDEVNAYRRKQRQSSK